MTSSSRESEIETSRIPSARFKNMMLETLDNLRPKLGCIVLVDPSDTSCSGAASNVVSC